MRIKSMKPGFHRDPEAIAKIAKEDKGINAALHDVADPIADDAGGFTAEYVTDRQVVAVMGKIVDQAKDGAATKAAGRRGLTLGGDVGGL